MARGWDISYSSVPIGIGATLGMFSNYMSKVTIFGYMHLKQNIRPLNIFISKKIIRQK